MEMIIDENKKKNNTNNKVENESNYSVPDFTIWNLNSLYYQTIRKSRNSNNRITRRKLKNYYVPQIEKRNRCCRCIPLHTKLFTKWLHNSRENDYK